MPRILARPNIRGGLPLTRIAAARPSHQALTIDRAPVFFWRAAPGLDRARWRGISPMRKLLLALAVAGLVTPAFADDVTVAVTSIVEHPALNAARDGIKEALEAAGYKDGANGFHFVFETAQGKPEI